MYYTKGCHTNANPWDTQCLDHVPAMLMLRLPRFTDAFLETGQNIFWASRSKPTQIADAAKAWYKEITDPGYDFKTPGFAMGTGHFSQLVWQVPAFLLLPSSPPPRFSVLKKQTARLALP